MGNTLAFAALGASNDDDPGFNRSSELHPDDMMALRELISSKVEYPVFHANTSQVFQDEYRNRKRRYFICKFVGKSAFTPVIRVFVKFVIARALLRRMEPLHDLLSRRNIDEFRVPLYYGCMNLYHEDMTRIAGVWEYVINGSSARGVWFGPKSRAKIACAAAAMTALTEDVRREVPRLRPAAPFLRPLAERVDQAITHFCDRGLDVNGLRDRAAELAAREPAALDRLRALGSYLTHNDYRSKNVFLSDRDQPVIFDWHSASYGPPGSTLRTMARQPDEALKEVVGLYCSHLETQGWSFRQDDVMFALRATNVFRALDFGAKNSSRLDNSRDKQLKWGLENLHHLAS